MQKKHTWVEPETIDHKNQPRTTNDPFKQETFIIQGKEI